MYKLVHTSIAIVALIMSACSSNGNNEVSELSEDVMPAYETQWFSYPDTDSMTSKRYNLCEVNYYVNGDTVFTSEKYHFLSLTYSWDEDSTLAYHHFVFFDREQTANDACWYHVVIDRNKIPREPDTHISAIVLRSYMGDNFDYKNSRNPHVNAYLFNATREIEPHNGIPDTLTPQLSKLYETIK